MPDEREDFIRETQMYQRVAKLPETPANELGREFDEMRKSRKKKES
jgi:hypothetical protein